jgi:flotillin
MTAAIAISVVISVVFISIIWALSSRYQRCPANRILVIYGKTGKGAAKCIHGGAAFVWPLFQDYAWLELEPFVVPIDLNNALSQENIRVTVPTTVTVAVSTEEGIMQNAAIRLLGQGVEEVQAQAQSVILGQMRQVMATMRIEEINRDRQAFMTKVNESLSVELEKIGLSVINVNIKDIEDDSGYIRALGRKAAAEAVNQALVDVAEQEKNGTIGVAQRQRDQKTAVAAANAAAAVGEAEAERDRRKALAAADSEAMIGEAEAARDRRQKVSMLEAEAVDIEAQASASVANSQATRKVAEEEARAKGQVALVQADGSIRVAEQDAQRQAEEARAQREQARLNAEVVVFAEAEKQKAILEAEAQRQKSVLIAKGEAEGVLARMQAEAEGVKSQLASKALGYKALVEACQSDTQLTAALLIIEKLADIAHIQADAVKNLPLEKVIVWDGGREGGLSDLGKRFMGVLPPMHELARVAGLELPEFLGKATGQATREPQEKELEPGT